MVSLRFAMTARAIHRNARKRSYKIIYRQALRWSRFRMTRSTAQYLAVRRRLSVQCRAMGFHQVAKGVYYDPAADCRYGVATSWGHTYRLTGGYFTEEEDYYA